MQHSVINVINDDLVRIVLSATRCLENCRTSLKPILNLPWKWLSKYLKTVVHCLFRLSDKIEICLYFLKGHCIHPIGEFKLLNRILQPIV